MNLICIKCKEKNKYIPLSLIDKNNYYCKICSSIYPIEDGIIKLISPELLGGELLKYYDLEYIEKNPKLHLKDVEWKYKEMKIILEKLNIKKLNKVLDIGTGGGYILNKIIEDFKTEERVAIDISSAILKEAKNKLLHATLVQAESTNLPFENNSFDLTLIIDVLEHCANPLKALIEAKRVSNFIFMKIPLEISLKDLIKKNIFKINWKDEFGHLHKYSEKKIQELIIQAGLKKKESKILKAPLLLYENISLHKVFLIILFNFIDKLFHLKRYQLNESNLFILCYSE